MQVHVQYIALLGEMTFSQYYSVGTGGYSIITPIVLGMKAVQQTSKQTKLGECEMRGRGWLMREGVTG